MLGQARIFQHSRRALVPCTRLLATWTVGAARGTGAAIAMAGAKEDPRLAKKLAGSRMVELQAVGGGVPSAGGPTPSSQLRRFGTLLDRANDVVAVGGHRGMGMNPWSADRTHAPGRYRENTLASFKEAARCGATFVEFDVQTTQDGVPVIWHDNYIVFGDPAAPTSKLIRELTYAEFRELAPINAASGQHYVQTAWLDSGSESGSEGGSESGTASSPPPSRRRRLLRKLHNHSPAVPGDASLASWECSQDDMFPTLEEVFAGLPADVAFDIEVKMTTPDDEPATPPEEVARQLDAILAVVDAQLALAPRLVLFSSFDPEICTELKRRRPRFPVMFLSGGGAYAHVDARRTSIPAAVEFAAGAGLDGVILETSRLRGATQWVEAARNQGLQVMTYGTENDDADWVRKQFYLGVHGVIVDDVAGVATALSAAVA